MAVLLTTNKSFYCERMVSIMDKNIEKTIASPINYFSAVVTTTITMDTLAGMRQLYSARLLSKKQEARIKALSGKADKASELAKAVATKQASDTKNAWLNKFSANLDTASDNVKTLIKLGCGDFSALDNNTQLLAFKIIGKIQDGQTVTGQEIRDFIKSASKALNVDIVPARAEDETISESFMKMSYKDYKPVSIRSDGKKHVDSLNAVKFITRSVEDFERVFAVYVYDSWCYTSGKAVIESAKSAKKSKK